MTSTDTRHPSKTDLHVGQRIRRARLAAGLSQEKLATHCGITFQQIQKCETGRNRISAGRLYVIAQRTGVPVSYFYDGLDTEAPEGSPELNQAAAIFDTRDGAALAAAFASATQLEAAQ